ncbi:MAG: L,D-transpeptidase [Clostridia bacterium]|nr:L,D-transpeptidase [Clostridia bacterium]
MIKVFKIRTILKILILVTAIVISILIIKNKVENEKAVATSSNNRQKYKILVDVEDSKLYLFENDELKKEYKCSGGKWSTPSPIGTWTVTSKAKWGEGFGRQLAWT